MTNLELVLHMLAATTTTETAKEKDPRGFEANKHIARQGGMITENTRKEIEERISRPVVTSKNTEDLLKKNTMNILKAEEDSTSKVYEKPPAGDTCTGRQARYN